MDPFNQGAAGMAYSPVNLELLGSMTQSLIGLGIDESDSMGSDTDANGNRISHIDETRQMLKDVSKANAAGKYAGSIITRAIGISDAYPGNTREVHGFLPAANIDPAVQYASLTAGGLTPLTDGAFDLLWSIYDQGKKLHADEVVVNAIGVIFTDGMDNRSRRNTAEVADLIRKMRTEIDANGLPLFDSVKMLVIGINATRCKAALEAWTAAIGLDPKEEYIDAGEMTPTKYGRMMALLTQTISQTAANLGSGSPTQMNAAQAANILNV